MHFLMFRIKRALLSGVRAAKEFCKEVELTPTRFDYLRAASSHPEGTPQKEITRILGLSSAAVSKMLLRLVEIGLVTRERSVRDRRTFVVRVTEEGVRRMREAYARLTASRNAGDYFPAYRAP